MYLGLTLNDIRQNFITSRDETEITIDALSECLIETISNSAQLKNADDIVFYIECITEELQGFRNIFDWLIEELPKAVKEKHYEMLLEIAEYAKDLDYVCLEFKRQHLEGPLKDESMRWLLDRIYKESRSQMLAYRSLFNLAMNLKTFVGTPESDRSLSIDDLDILELKPNIFGIGLNLNYLIKRLSQWLKRLSGQRSE